MTAAPTGRVLVVGLGNAERGDDAVGLDLVRDLRPVPGVDARAHRGEALDLLSLWGADDAVVLVDAVHSADAPGTVHRVVVRDGPLALDGGPASTHLFGLRETIELARTLERLPARLVVLGVTGARFEPGSGFSPGLRAALPALRDAVEAEIRSARDLVAGRSTPCTNAR